MENKELVKELFEDFPDNTPLSLDSGLWQVRSEDDPDEVLVQQGVNEHFVDFIERVKTELY